MKNLFIFYLLAISLFNSCSYDCVPAEIDFNFIGYSKAEIDTVILKRFSKSGNFTNAIDTLLITTDNVTYQERSDTLSPVSSTGIVGLITSEYDYEFDLPRVSRIYRIKNITEEDRSKKFSLSTSKVQCVNLMNSYIINGQYVAANNSSSTLFLKK